MKNAVPVTAGAMRAAVTVDAMGASIAMPRSAKATAKIINKTDPARILVKNILISY
jgi:hypothetical protein